MEDIYIIDITKPPVSPPNREFVIGLFGERETVDSQRKSAEYEQYITAYFYEQAIEERKNNERENG